MRSPLTSTTVTSYCGHLAAIIAIVGPPTCPAPMQRMRFSNCVIGCPGKEAEYPLPALARQTLAVALPTARNTVPATRKIMEKQAKICQLAHGSAARGGLAGEIHDARASDTQERPGVHGNASGGDQTRPGRRCAARLAGLPLHRGRDR